MLNDHELNQLLLAARPAHDTHLTDPDGPTALRVHTRARSQANRRWLHRLMVVPAAGLFLVSASAGASAWVNENDNTPAAPTEEAALPAEDTTSPVSETTDCYEVADPAEDIRINILPPEQWDQSQPGNPTTCHITDPSSPENATELSPAE